MAYYFLAHYTVKDPQTWQSYAQQAMPTIDQYGGKILAAAGPRLQEPHRIEATAQHAVSVILEFDAQADFERWYTSPDYQKVINMRLDSTEGWAQGLPAFQMPTG
jgi:uncharacterized protein (DUF1330 family)